jgi:streptogramin lyase
LLTINEFATPTPSSIPYFITAGPDGNVWFTENRSNKIGQITPQGSIAEFPILPVTSNANPAGITTGPDGNVWFTESNANKIGRIMPDGTHNTEFSIPSSNSGPLQITSGPDGGLWFSEVNAHKIGRLDPATGHVAEFPVSNVTAYSEGGTSLAFGPDGDLWFTEPSANMIGRITPDGSQIIELPIPTPGSVPVGITAGPDGNLWFVERNGNQIARINPSNYSVREFKIPTANSIPEQVTTAPDGNLWFTEYSADKIGRISPDGKIEEFATPISGSRPYSITAGPDGNIWFTENGASKIGELNLTLPASRFVVSAPSTSTAGTPFGITITALDAANRTVTGYTGTVHLTSSDSLATLPADYTFTADDNGVHTFSNGVTLLTAGTQMVTATDTATGITGSATITVALPPPPVDQFIISAPETVVAGSTFAITVTGLDAHGQVATGYTNTVTFTSSDPYPGALPPDYTFTESESGTHSFAGVALFTAGTQILTVQDSTHGSITGSATINVHAAPASRLLISAPPTAVAGTSFDVKVSGLDPYGNVDTGYIGTVALLSSDRYPQVSDYTFTPGDNGTHSFVLSLFTAGAQTIFARDAVNSSMTGTASVAVSAAPADHFLITAPSTAVSGTSFDLIITALDPYGNIDTNYQGTVAFTTSDPVSSVVLPSSYTFTSGDGGDNGVHIFPGGVALITAGDQTVTATDKVSGITGSTTITVGGGNAAPLGHRTGSPSTSATNINSALIDVAPVDRLFSSPTEEKFGLTVPEVFPCCQLPRMKLERSCTDPTGDAPCFFDTSQPNKWSATIYSTTALGPPLPSLSGVAGAALLTDDQRVPDPHARQWSAIDNRWP